MPDSVLIGIIWKYGKIRKYMGQYYNSLATIAALTLFKYGADL